MAPMKLSLTNNFRNEETSDLCRRLVECLRVDPPEQSEIEAEKLKGKGDGLKWLIELVGDPLAWEVLETALRAVVSTLAGRAVDKIWKALEELLRDGQPKKLTAFAEAYTRLIGTAGPGGQITWVYWIKNSDFRVEWIVESDQLEDLKMHVARFALHAAKIPETIQRNENLERAPVGWARVETRKDGSLRATWFDGAAGRERRTRISVDDTESLLREIREREDC